MVRSVVGKVVWMASAAETKHKKRGPSSRRLSLVMAFFLAVATLMATATAALAVAFSNTTFMTIPDGGNASPYPSSITVSGLTGTIIDVNVTLSGLSHTWPDDVAVLLVGPGGQKVILMSDVGGGAECFGGGPVSNVSLNFDDQAANTLPDSTQIVSGTYRPTQGTTDTSCGNLRPSDFPPPAPSGPYINSLNVFNGANPNGTYHLYVIDDTTPDGGSISGGWTLDLLTLADTTAPRVTSVEPAEDATGIGPGANISAFFSEAMRARSINTNTVKLFKVGESSALGASVSYGGGAKKATLDPSTNLQRGARYRAVVTTGAKDKAGNRLDQDQNPSNGNQPKVWYFTVRN